MTQVAIANEKAVRRLTENVVNYFGFLASNEARLSNVDIFMAIHNIHVHVLLNMEQQSGMPEEDKLFLRKIALDTFAQAMENKPSLPAEKELMKLFAFRMMHYGPELLASLKDAISRLEDFIETDCECDNTHEQNETECCLCGYQRIIKLIEGEEK